MDRRGDPTPSQIATALRAWRTRSLDVAVWVLLLAFSPILPLLIFEWPPIVEASTPMRAACLVIYVLLVAIAVCSSVETRWRAWAFCLALYVLAGIQLYRAGMAGGGRITLLTIPLYALLLIGRRSSWAALLLAMLMYGTFTGLAAWGFVEQHMEVRDNPVEAGFWGVHGILLLAGVVPLLVLLGRFLTLHVKVLLEQRRLEEEITRVSEEERRRLGSELHDVLCQQLTAALLQCTSLEQLKASGKPIDGVQLQTIRTMLEESMGMAYDVAHGLYPLDYGAELLGSALERLARRAGMTSGVKCSLHVEGEPTELEEEQISLHIYRIAQEAVTNAIKHGHPQQIALTLCRASWGTELQVEDDGRGMPMDVSQSSGMGLRIMAYRAEILGGQLSIEDVPGGGTRILCRVPRQKRSDGQNRDRTQPAPATPSSDESGQKDRTHD